MDLASAAGGHVLGEPLPVGGDSRAEGQVGLRCPEGAELETVDRHLTGDLGQVEHDVPGEVLVSASLGRPALEVDLVQLGGPGRDPDHQRCLGRGPVAVGAVQLDGLARDRVVVDHVRLVGGEVLDVDQPTLCTDGDRVGKPGLRVIHVRQALVGLGHLGVQVGEVGGDGRLLREQVVDVGTLERHGLQVEVATGGAVGSGKGARVVAPCAAAPGFERQTIDTGEAYGRVGLGGRGVDGLGVVPVGDVEGTVSDELPGKDAHRALVDGRHRVVGVACSVVDHRKTVRSSGGDRTEGCDRSFQLGVAERGIALGDDGEPVVHRERVERSRRCRGSRRAEKQRAGGQPDHPNDSDPLLHRCPVRELAN